MSTYKVFLILRSKKPRYISRIIEKELDAFLRRRGLVILSYEVRSFE